MSHGQSEVQRQGQHYLSHVICFFFFVKYVFLAFNIFLVIKNVLLFFFLVGIKTEVVTSQIKTTVNLRGVKIHESKVHFCWFQRIKLLNFARIIVRALVSNLYSRL